MFRKNCVAGVLVALVCMLFCGASALAETQYSALNIYKTKTNIAVGETSQVTLVNNSGVQLGNTSGVSYSSSNETVATVDNSGVITGINPGITIINVHIENNIPVLADKKIVVVVRNGDALFSQGFEDYPAEEGDRCTTDKAKSGNQSCIVGGSAGWYNFTYKLPADASRDYCSWERQDNCVVEAWFYDARRTGDDVKIRLQATGESDSAELLRVGITGSNYTVKPNNSGAFVYTQNSVTNNTIARTEGWHQIVFDMSAANDFNGNGIRRIYIDGELLFEESYSFENENYIKIGGIVGNITSISDVIYFDEFNAYSVEPIAVDEVSFEDENGNEIEKLADFAEKTVYAKTDVTEGVIILALYSGNELENVMFETISENADRAAMVLPQNVGGMTLKAFVWDGLGLMTPVTDVYDKD